MMQNYFSNPLMKNEQKQNYINSMLAASQIQDPYQRYVMQQDIRNDDVSNSLGQYFQNQSNAQNGQSYPQLYARVMNNQATPSDYRNLMLLSNPEMAKVLQSHFAMRKTEENEKDIKAWAPIMFSLKFNNAEQAHKLIDQQIKVAQQNNDPDELEMLESVKNLPPMQASLLIGSFIGQMPEGEKVLKNLLEREQLQASVIDKQNQAKISTDEAKYSDVYHGAKAAKEAAAVTGQQLENYNKAKEGELKSIELKYKENKEMLDRQYKENQISKQEYEAKEELLKKETNSKVSEAFFDNTMNTINELEKSFNNGFDNAFGVRKSIVPTLLQDTADVEENVKTLQSQQFLQNVEKMQNLGALSDAEGTELKRSIASLSFRQSPEQAKKNILTIKKYIMKMQNFSKIENAKRNSSNIKVLDYK